MRSFLAVLALAWVGPLAAQSIPTGTVHVMVTEEMGPVDEALIRVDSLSVLTDYEGRARLVLPAGRRTMTIGRIGYHPRRISFVVLPDTAIHLPVTLEMEMVELEDIVVSAARTERLAGETPIRVEVISEMEVDEKTQMAPSGISMLLNETPGVRVQSVSPSLGTGAVRILGLPGQYTALLADGLPLYGGAASSIGPLDISPVDLARVEVIKGPASALYGGQALGGVINLISKPPTGRNEVLLNRRTLGVTDGAAWLSRRLSTTTGISLLVSGTMQTPEDLDSDGWRDQADADRWGVRPRLTFVDGRGRSLFVTAGYGFDRRLGGTVPGAVAPDSLPFREELSGRRVDLGMSGRLPTGERSHLALRFVLSANDRDRRFGSANESDRISTGFLEVTRGSSDPRGAEVIGVVLQRDAYRNDLNDGYDHRWWTPGAFATAERDIGPLTASLSTRVDAHPEAGTRVTGRAAILAKPITGWDVRLAAGTGFAPGTAQLEETEATGLSLIRPGAALRHEESFGATLDIGGKVGAWDLLVTGFRAEVRDAVQLADPGDASGEAILVNAAGPAKYQGIEALAIWRFPGGKLFLSYGFADATRTDATTGAREPTPLLPRHRLGADLMLEKPGVYRVGLEGTVFGVQALDDDPYATESEPYVYTMFLVMRQFGAVEVVANFENLFNVRQTDFAPLVRPMPMAGGRWTVDGWAPMEGFMANVALRYRW
jgi:outer membrane receptor for ferrienterochelin and colicins